MNISRFGNRGGFKSIVRYINMLTDQSQWVNASTVVAFGTQSSPYIEAYAFGSSSGFGSKFSSPASNMGFYVNDTEFSKKQDVLFAAGYGGAYDVSAYKFSSSGFGTKYTNATVPGTVWGISCNDADSAVLVAHDTSPYISAFPFNYTTGFGTKYSNPATLPSGNGTAAKLSDNYAFIGTNTTPMVAAYPFNASTGFGTKYSDPATAGPYSTKTIEYNPYKSVVFFGGIGYGYAFPWSSSGFGTKYAQPAESFYSYGSQFNRLGNYIAVSAYSSPYIYAYQWSNGWGTKYSDPATLPNGAANGYSSASVAGIGNAVVMLSTVSPYLQGYPFNISTGFGTKYSNPATTPSTVNGGVAFN